MAISITTLPKGSKLFHGTIESFSGGLRPGGYDEVAWFADSASIAQLYIPPSGSSMLTSADNLRLPVERADVQAVQKAIGIEYDLSKVKWQRNGQPESWPLPNGWKKMPTKQDVAERLEKIGYKPGDYGNYQFMFNGDKLLAPGEKQQGTLFIGTTKRDMKLWVKARGEGDLQNLQYHDLKGFRAAEALGLDGVLIDDFAQSKSWGNLGHLSVGLFERSLKDVSFETVPATYEEWDRKDETTAWPHKGNVDFMDLVKSSELAEPPTGEVKASSAKLPFIGQCDRIRRRGPEGEWFWQQAMANAKPVSIEEFELACDVPAVLDEDESLEDFSQSGSCEFFRSEVDGQPVWFMACAGFEFLFAQSAPAKTSASSKVLGYKVMRYDPERKLFVSVADGRLTVSPDAKEIKFPGLGIFLSTNKQFVLNHYRGIADNEVLLTLEFDPADVKRGSLTDREPDLAVSKVRLVDVEFLDSEDEL
jgi:hypothetical protein